MIISQYLTLYSAFTDKFQICPKLIYIVQVQIKNVITKHYEESHSTWIHLRSGVNFLRNNAMKSVTCDIERQLIPYKFIL